MHLRATTCALMTVGLTAFPMLPAAWAREIAVPQTQIERLEIRLAKLRAAREEPVAVLPATIVPPLNSRLAIPAPFAGTVVHVDALPGHAIGEGEPLVTVASRDLVDTIVKLRQAEADLQVAKVVAQRQRELADKTLVAPSRVEETASQAARIEALVAETSRLLAVGNLRVNPDRTYTLTAPKAGRIVETRASPGSGLQAMDTAAVIDTGRDVWAQAQVPASLIDTIRVGDRVETATGATGRVLSVGVSIDPLTRSAQLLAELSGPTALVPGSMTTITVARISDRRGLEAPAEAVAWIDGGPHVFVRTRTGFNSVAVKLRGRSQHQAILEADLAPGQEVVTSGLAQLEKMVREE